LMQIPQRFFLHCDRLSMVPTQTMQSSLKVCGR
jgi:hypothetical protein